MARVVKKNHIRRAEILEITGLLFQSQGYAETSVEDIVRAVGIAKGTFYYYFKSKEQILDALVTQETKKLEEESQKITEDPDKDANQKLCQIIALMQMKDNRIFEGIHHPSNNELHKRSNIETVKVFGPILGAVVEQGCREGIYHVEDPQSTMQLILGGALFLLGHDTFTWTEQEQVRHSKAIVALIERAIGAKENSITNVLDINLKSCIQLT